MATKPLKPAIGRPRSWEDDDRTERTERTERMPRRRTAIDNDSTFIRFEKSFRKTIRPWISPMLDRRRIQQRVKSIRPLPEPKTFSKPFRTLVTKTRSEPIFLPLAGTWLFPGGGAFLLGKTRAGLHLASLWLIGFLCLLFPLIVLQAHKVDARLVGETGWPLVALLGILAWSHYINSSYRLIFKATWRANTVGITTHRLNWLLPLVFPGAGHIYSGHRGRGIFFGVAALTGLVGSYLAWISFAMGPLSTLELGVITRSNILLLGTFLGVNFFPLHLLAFLDSLNLSALTARSLDRRRPRTSPLALVTGLILMAFVLQSFGGATGDYYFQSLNRVYRQMIYKGDSEIARGIQSLLSTASKTRRFLKDHIG